MLYSPIILVWGVVYGPVNVLSVRKCKVPSCSSSNSAPTVRFVPGRDRCGLLLSYTMRMTRVYWYFASIDYANIFQVIALLGRGTPHTMVVVVVHGISLLI